MVDDFLERYRKSLNDENRKVVMDMTGIRMLAYFGYNNDDRGE